MHSKFVFHVLTCLFAESPRERLMRADRREQLNHIFKGCTAWQWGGHLCSGLVWSLDHAGFYQHNLLQCPLWWESTHPPLADRLPTPTDFSPVCGPHINTHKLNVATISPRRIWNHTGGKTQNTNIWLLIITKMISVEALRLNLLILIGCMEGSSHFLNKQWELSFSIFRVQWVSSYINKWKVQWGGAVKSFTYS